MGADRPQKGRRSSRKREPSPEFPLELPGDVLRWWCSAIECEPSPKALADRLGNRSGASEDTLRRIFDYTKTSDPIDWSFAKGVTQRHVRDIVAAAKVASPPSAEELENRLRESIKRIGAYSTWYEENRAKIELIAVKNKTRRKQTESEVLYKLYRSPGHRWMFIFVTFLNIAFALMVLSACNAYFSSPRIVFWILVILTLLTVASSVSLRVRLDWIALPSADPDYAKNPLMMASHGFWLTVRDVLEKVILALVVIWLVLRRRGIM